MLDPVGPVGAHGHGIRVLDREPHAVGDHRRHRHGDRHGLAVGHHEGGVGEDRPERAELGEVLRRLEDPPGGRPLVAVAQVGAHLEHPAQVAVGLGLVGGVEPVAVAGEGDAGLEEHGGEVQGQQLDLLVHVVGRHLVHAHEVGHGVVDEAEGGVRAGAAGVGVRWGTVGCDPLGVAQHGLERLPIGQRAQARVGGQQIVEVGGPGAGQAGDDDRSLEGQVEDLGVAGDLVLDEQAVDQQLGEQGVLRHQPHRAQAGVVGELVAQQAQRFEEAGVAEVVEPGRLRGGVHQHRRPERQVGGEWPDRRQDLGDVVGEARRGQVVEAHGRRSRPARLFPHRGRPYARREGVKCSTG